MSKEYTEEQRQARREASKRWKAKNKDKRRNSNRKWVANNPCKTLYLTMQRNSKKRGHELILTYEEVQAIVEPMVCQMTGVSLAWDTEDWTPSIDRIDNQQGYKPGNVRLVAWIVNRARANGTDENLLRMARGLVAHFGM